MDINQQNLDILFRNVQVRFSDLYKQTPTWWQQVASLIPSGTRAEDYAWMDRLPVMRQWLGNRVVNSVSNLTRRLVNVPYESTIRLSKWDVEDDQYGVFNMAVDVQAAEVAKWPDTLVATAIRFGASDTLITGVSNVGFDGVPVFSTRHPVLAGVDGAAGTINGASTQSNLYTNLPLTFDNYVRVRTDMMSWVGADGLPLNILPNMLMVPPALENMGKMILEADMVPTTTAVLPGGATQANSPMTNTYKGSATLFVNPMLADKPQNWWLMDTTKPIKPWIFQQRSAPTFTAKTNINDDNVFFLAEFLWGAEARGAAAESVWFLQAAATANTTTY
jgi:phage major head subunit gpT-like protein